MTPASGSGFDESAFSTASNVLQEIMTRSSLAGGAGTSTLTELVLVWLNEYRDRSKPHQSTTPATIQTLDGLSAGQMGNTCVTERVPCHHTVSVVVNIWGMEDYVCETTIAESLAFYYWKPRLKARLRPANILSRALSPIKPYLKLGSAKLK